MKYRKKPTLVDAEQYVAGALPLGATFVRHPGEGHSGPCGPICDQRTVAGVWTTQGFVPIREGDWVAHQIVGGKHDYWPISAETFAATYEPVEDEAAKEGR